ncbi:MAG: hypothetical protein JW760_10115 [Spirochaetales bacterium]|nr:hypothetical protein [Spirochaetales bacterium]
MLPSNKGFVFFCAVLTLLLSAGLPAEETGVLKRGPIETQGIPLLPRNAHHSYFGEYVYRGETLKVYVTFTEIFRPETWKRSDCDVYETYLVPSEQGETVYVYRNDGGWTLVAGFPSSGEHCRFLNELIRKLIYFQGVSGGNRSFSFPAVLTFPD